MIKTTINDCKVIKLNTILRPEGRLTIVEEHKDVPFGISRIYYIHDIPDSSERGHHAHKSLKQLMIAISGSFQVLLNDGKDIRMILLDNPEEGLLIVPGIWRTLGNFKAGSVCLVLASSLYSEEDYIRNYDDYLKYKK